MRYVKKSITCLAVILVVAMLWSTAVFASSYTVKSGDTLYKIGLAFNTTASKLMSDNNLSGTMIYPGQTLKVPATAHTVKAGDTLYLIAKKYGVTVNEIRQCSNKWDDMIYPGQILLIPKTGSLLSSASSSSANSTKSSGVSYSSAELDLLARLVRSEAENQPYEAQVAVAAVVINRMKSDLFPNTISSIIYEKSYGYYQFTPVENGMINNAATTTAKNAALAALNGSDPSKGSLYYFDDSATNKWLWSKEIRARIGNMVYVY
jgi:spore germination cell wall hydrolase CwlJ-like protein